MAFQEEVLTLPTATNDRRHEDIFYTGMASAILLTILTGFGASYYWRAAPFSALVYLHAGVFTGWVLLFFAQTVLVAAGHTRLHRRLGVAGGGLAGLMIVLGPVTAIHGARNIKRYGPKRQRTGGEH